MKNIFRTLLDISRQSEVFSVYCMRNVETMKNILLSFSGISSFIRRFQAMENISYSPLDISTQSEEYYSFFIRHSEAE